MDGNYMAGNDFLYNINNFFSLSAEGTDEDENWF
jgi:hypothetical protein